MIWVMASRSVGYRYLKRARFMSWVGLWIAKVDWFHRFLDVYAGYLTIINGVVAHSNTVFLSYTVRNN